MKFTLLLVVMSCAVVLVYGDLLCGTDYCTLNPCTTPLAPEACLPPTVYREKHAGKCACCPACVTLLPEGAACKSYSKQLGETPSSICQDWTRCDKGVCVKSFTRLG